MAKQNGDASIVVDVRANLSRLDADLRRAERVTAGATRRLERIAQIAPGVGASGFGAAALSGIGAGGGKAAVAKVAGMAALFAAVDQGLDQFSGAFKAPENRNRGFLPVAFEGAQAASGAFLTQAPIIGKALDAIASAADFVQGNAPGAGYSDALNMDRRFFQNRAASVRAVAEGPVRDTFTASTPFGQFSAGGDATALLREIAANTRSAAKTNAKMATDSGFH